MKIYTKTGDKGETGLFGGQRVSKDHPRICAYGTVDELNSFIGLAIIEVKNQEVKDLLFNIQNKLFTIGSDLATPETEKNSKLKIQRADKSFIDELEKQIDYFSEKLEPLRNFILPGGTKASALLHICRTISRRAEREVVVLKKMDSISDIILIYLNRLSDLFFVLSRFENQVSGIPDTKWRP